MRNPSKNTAKQIMRRAYLSLEDNGIRQWGDENNYFLCNSVGTRLYIMSKGVICNREPKGYKKHCKNTKKYSEK